MVSRGLPVAQRWARIGPRDPSWLIHIPQAGLCLSAFVVIRKGNKILLGRPHAHNAWPENGGFPKRHAGEIERKGSWLLPATHLLMEEKPDHAAKRIANQWVKVRGTPKFVMVQSHLRPSKLSRSRMKRGRRLKHWDICFIYELHAKNIPKPAPWWSEVHFFPVSEIRRMRLGRGHKDVLEETRYL